MARKNNCISVHKCIFSEQARKVLEAINSISDSNSLSACDTKAIRLLTEVYDVLANPVQENDELLQGVGNSGRSEESQ